MAQFQLFQCPPIDYGNFSEWIDIKFRIMYINIPEWKPPIAQGQKITNRECKRVSESGLGPRGAKFEIQMSLTPARVKRPGIRGCCPFTAPTLHGEITEP